MSNYLRLGVMVLTLTLALLGLTYMNTYRLDQVFFSETRAYMTVIMGAAITVILLAFMPDMYQRRRLNIGIVVAASLVFAGALELVRTQATVDDVAYMKAMIPHQSVSILTSARARISDPRVRVLADEIIMSRRRGIERMKSLIEDLEGRGDRERRAAAQRGH